MTSTNYTYAAPSLQAVDYFTNGRLWDPATGAITEEKKASMLPPRKTSRYSATLGGPVVLPHIYNGRSKTFWTYGFQGFNRRQRNNDFFTVPMEAQRSGDFSALLALNKNYQIYDPLTTKPAADGRLSRDPFAGNKIPSNRLDPMAQKILKDQHRLRPRLYGFSLRAYRSDRQKGSRIPAYLRGSVCPAWGKHQKPLKITERLKMQIRTQWEGAMNHPQFSDPNMAPTNTLFSTINSIQGEARRIYVGTKMLF